jgi:hypothetical protein
MVVNMFRFIICFQDICKGFDFSYAVASQAYFRFAKKYLHKNTYNALKQQTIRFYFYKYIKGRG